MLPLFKSHFSTGRSILTLNPPDKCVDGGPDSVFKLAKENDLEEVILVEDSFSGFLQAKKNAEELNIKLIFGLRFLMAEDIGEKLTRDNNNKHRIVLYKFLKKAWDKNLKLAVPFYDSFLFTNLVSFSNCVPDFSFCTPTFFIEENNLPFDFIVKPAVEKYCKENNFATEKVKSIYYNKKTDAKAFQTYKCLCSRGFGRQSTLEEPHLDHFGSDDFCFESWKKQNETT